MANATVILAEEPRAYTCGLLKEPPVLDGKADDLIWNNLPEESGFYVLGDKTFAVERPTSFRAGWTSNALYLAVRCTEPTPAKLTSDKKDCEDIWSDDSIEIFIYPEPGGNSRYFQMVVNSVGKRFNGIGESRSTTLWDWDASTHIGTNFWSLEVKVPLEVIRFIPRNRGVWKMNIARNNWIGANAAERYTCWPRLKNGFHETENFGVFYFVTNSFSADEINRKAPYAMYLQKRAREIAGEYPKYRGLVENSVKSGILKQEGMALKIQWEWIVRVNDTGTSNIGEISSGFPAAFDLVDKTEEFQIRTMMELLFE